MGQTAWNKGIPMSEAQKQQISITKKANLDPDHQRHMTEVARQANLGTPRSEETRKKIGDAHRGIPSEMRGIPRTEETKQKVSEGIRSSEKFQESVKSRTGKTRKNTSGHPGVIWDKNRNQWMVRVAKKNYGRFDNLEDATAKSQEILAIVLQENSD